MGLTETIAEIQNSDWDKGSEFAKKLAADLKNLETVNQKKLADLVQQSETILAVAGAEGADFAEKMVDAGKKIAQLDERNKDLSASLAARDAELSDIKQSALLAKVATKSGVNTNVLKALIKEEDKLEVDEDKVTVNGTEIKDWAKNNQSDFYASLFPKTYGDVELPGGGSKGADLPEGGSKSKVQQPGSKPSILKHDRSMIQKNLAYYGA